MTSLLASIRTALAVPFADPVMIEGVPVPRREARAAERVLDRVERHGERVCHVWKRPSFSAPASASASSLDVRQAAPAAGGRLPLRRMPRVRAAAADPDGVVR